jgi:hypothetical protein
MMYMYMAHVYLHAPPAILAEHCHSCAPHGAQGRPIEIQERHHGLWMHSKEGWHVIVIFVIPHGYYV